jgi:hypothetical protein
MNTKQEKLMYELYGLTKEEIAIVESACVEKKTSAKQTADKPADKGKSS